MNRALASPAKPNAHVENPDLSGTGFLTHRGMIVEAGSSKEERAIALNLSDGHPSPMGEGPGVRAFKAKT